VTTNPTAEWISRQITEVGPAHPGRFVMLLPRGLDMIAAARDMPLPVPKPKILEIEVKKHNDYGKVGSAKSDE
jgi:hypothetical protein